ncbi:unnamed protein product [Ranitomeya imitator]|uniref:Uncharacterized protein n=1 Tax=Ranitomeya imitator TaxID=111125 RepID=A0ABN9MPQ3_9NEOB|nr:unnamed protein product [Ranitomeya imitator]
MNAQYVGKHMEHCGASIDKSKTPEWALPVQARMPMEKEALPYLLDLYPKREKARVLREGFCEGLPINDSISKEEARVRYKYFDRIFWEKQAGRVALLAKSDIEAAFRLLPIHVECFHLEGCYLEAPTYSAALYSLTVSNTTVIGSNVNNIIKQNKMTLLLLKSQTGLFSSTYYLDYFLLVGPDDLQLYSFQSLMRELGFPLSEEKAQWPVRCLTFLGIETDKDYMVFMLSIEKVEKLQHSMTQIPHRIHCYYGRYCSARSCTPSLSAQEAELQALSTACVLAKDRRANIYTDSQYAFGIAHDFGAVWANQGFITTAGTPVKNAEAVKTLMDSIKLPTQVAIIKVKEHGPRNSSQTVGNTFAVLQAKAAALLPVEQTIPTMVTTRSQCKQLQETLTLQEPDDPRQTEVFCQTPRDRLMTMQRMSPKEEHSTVHVTSVRPAIPVNFNVYPQSILLSLCLANYPFQRLQVDHITLPKSGRYEYCLVVADMFSKWPEAFPVTNMTAKTTAKKLVMEVICRYGVPEVVKSDQGPAFSSHVYQEVLTMLGSTIQQKPTLVTI